MGKTPCTDRARSSPIVKNPYPNCVLGMELFCTRVPTNRGRRVCMKAHRARRVRLGASPLGWARCAWVITGVGGSAGGGQAVYGLGQGPVLAVAPPRAAPRRRRSRRLATLPVRGHPSRRGAGAVAPRIVPRADSPVGGWEWAGGAGGAESRARPRGRLRHEIQIRQLAGGDGRAGPGGRGSGVVPGGWAAQHGGGGPPARPRRRGEGPRGPGVDPWGGGPQRYISPPGGCTTYPVYISPIDISSSRPLFQPP